MILIYQKNPLQTMVNMNRIKITPYLKFCKLMTIDSYPLSIIECRESHFLSNTNRVQIYNL